MVSLNVVSVISPHVPQSMLTTMVMCHNFMLEKTFVLHNFYVPAHACFYVQGECYFLQTSSGGRVRFENRGGMREMP